MANNITIPPTGTGTATPAVETIDITAGSGPQRQVVSISDRAGSTTDSIGGLTETAPASDTASSGLNGRLQRIAQRLSSLLIALPSGISTNGSLLVGSKISWPNSTLTRPANTTAYAQGDVISSNTTAGSAVVPTITLSGGGGSYGSLLSFVLQTNKASGMGGCSFAADIWFGFTAPTYTNGDNGVYAIATGAAAWAGSVTFANTIQVGDGAYAVGVPDVVAAIDYVSSSPTAFWTLQVTNAAGFTPASGQTFTLTPRIQQY